MQIPIILQCDVEGRPIRYIYPNRDRIREIRRRLGVTAVGHPFRPRDPEFSLACVACR